MAESRLELGLLPCLNNVTPFSLIIRLYYTEHIKSRKERGKERYLNCTLNRDIQNEIGFPA